MSAVLQPLFADQKLWRGRAPTPEALRTAPVFCRTGVAALDAALPWQGWPETGLIEILLAHDGLGELSLLMPLLAQQSQTKPVVLIDPPYTVFAPAWQARGVRLQQVQVVRCAAASRGLSPRDARPHAQDAQAALWACEQALRAGCCGVVMCWPQHIDDKSLRRLQVASETGHCLGIVMRDRQHAANASPAPLRLEVTAGERGPQLRVLKARGAMPTTRPIPLNTAALNAAAYNPASLNPASLNLGAHNPAAHPVANL